MKLLLCNGCLVRHVDTVQEFTDILVPYAADTLDRCRFRDVSEAFWSKVDSAYPIVKHSERRYPQG